MLSVDDLVGTVRGELARKGELRNSYIIFTSDNGYHRGEHRAPTKAKGGKRLPYETDIRVPLVVWGGEDTALVRGQERDEFVLNTDYAPTIADLAGADMPGADGSSFAPLLRGEDVPGRSKFLVEASAHKRIELPAYSAVRDQDGVYVDYESGRDEYYNLEADPYQLENLAPGFGEERIDTLQKKLAALRECSGESCRLAEGFPTPQN
jgi:arylsulfatase A-like enzyme